MFTPPDIVNKFPQWISCGDDYYNLKHIRSIKRDNKKVNIYFAKYDSRNDLSWSVTHDSSECKLVRNFDTILNKKN